MNHYKYLFLLLFAFANFQIATATNSSISKDSLNVPIYNFEELEPLLHQKGDTVYVVNFWATWCKPCVAELPYFVSLQNKYADTNLKVILVSLDFRKQIEKKLIPFIQKNKLELDVVVLSDPDANSWINKVYPDWSGAIPATLLYCQADRTFAETTFESYEELETLVLEFCEPKKD